MRSTKIVCTLGPASDSVDAIEDLAQAGMSVGRINASHGTREDHAAMIDRVRRVDDRVDTPLAVMLDLRGPEIRTGNTETPVSLSAGQTVRFEPGDTVSRDRIGLTTTIATAEPGDRVLLDDGRIETTVERIEGDTVVATVDVGGSLESRKGVNVPGVDLGLEMVTDEDREALALAAEREVDFVAASFVRDAADVLAVSEYLETLGTEIPIVAKIERAGAVDNLGEIIEAAQGVMVARGDLGVELPLEDVPLIQKRIIRRSQSDGTPVITATEMLDSMVHSGRPTRAEASDVANAVLDGTDAVMLSGETAIGDHPTTVVEAMDRIVRQIEESNEYAELREQRVPTSVDESRTEAVARSARYLAKDVGASAVVVASESGYTARKVAKFRPAVPVVAATPRDVVRRQLSLVWGVNAQLTTITENTATSVIEGSVQASVEAGLVDSGDTVVVVSGMMTGLDGQDTTNTLKVHVAAETLAVGRAVVDGRVSGPVARLESGDLSAIDEGTIVVLGRDFDDEFTGDVTKLGGVVSAESGMTGYAAMVAREVDVPMVSGADLPSVPDGTVVTIDGERGVVYRGEVRGQ